VRVESPGGDELGQLTGAFSQMLARIEEQGDVRMPPGWDGIETISRIWKEFPEFQVDLHRLFGLLVGRHRAHPR
jgi:hypothetical protein